MPAAAELQGVSKRFGDALALDDLHLAARQGEFLTLLGPSGCGKTTALRLLSGFEQPDTGRVVLDGKDVTTLPPYRREVNQVFQSYALFPHLTVARNIAFGLRMQRLPAPEIRRRVAAVAELTALGELMQRRPDQLSGGQRQRVALARALVCEPKVLLLDEPLSALDARLRAQVREELRRLQRRLGLTFIFVTHDQEEALSLSDRVAVMRAGRIEQIAGVEEIYARPATRFVASFIGEANLLETASVEKAGEGLLLCRLAAGGPALHVRAKYVSSARPTLLIRPEHVRLVAEVGNANSFTARVEDRAFQGAAVMLTLRLDKYPATHWRALSGADCGTDAALGTEAQVEIAPEDIQILPD